MKKRYWAEIFFLKNQISDYEKCEGELPMVSRVISSDGSLSVYRTLNNSCLTRAEALARINTHYPNSRHRIITSVWDVVETTGTNRVEAKKERSETVKAIVVELKNAKKLYADTKNPYWLHKVGFCKQTINLILDCCQLDNL